MFEVWHASNPTFGLEFLFSEMPTPEWPDDFHLVAKVRCDDPEEAFRLTQHIDVEWWDNDQVYLVEEGRSTSVGDLIVRGHDAYQVISFGFKKFAIKDGKLQELEEVNHASRTAS